MTAKFKKGDKVIYHGAGTNQTMEMMGVIGTISNDSYDTGHREETRKYVASVIFETGPWAKRPVTYYESNLDLYEKDDE